MINEHKHAKDDKLNCLFFYIHQKEGGQKFIDIITQASFFSDKNHVPKIWPTRIRQKGGTCGIYAVKSAAEYSGQVAPGSIPPARKSDDAQSIDDEKKPKISIRRLAKENGVTDIGAIFKIQHFTTLAKCLGLKNTKEFQLKKNESDYTKQLCEILESHHTIIIAIDANDGYPDSMSGTGAHWALIFGYIYLDDNCYFLVTQYNDYFLWKAEDIFYSNLNLPLKNPSYGVYAKTDDKDYEMVDGDTDFFSTDKLKDIKEDNLDDFRFRCFAVPSLHLKNKINDFSVLVEEYIKSVILDNPASKFITNKIRLIYYFEHITHFIDTIILNGETKTAGKPHSEYFKYFGEILESIPDKYYHDIFIGLLNKHIKNLRYSAFCKFSIRKIIFCLDYFVKSNLLEEIILITPEKHLEFVKKLLGILLINYAESGEFEKIKYICIEIPDINLDRQNNSGQYPLTSAAKNNNMSLVSWLPEKNVKEFVTDEKGHDCNFYLKINLIKLAKKYNCENIFKMAFEQKHNLLISNSCLVGCLNNLDYFFQLQSIINTYFEVYAKMSSVNILSINNKNKDIFKHILNKTKLELQTIKPEKLSTFDIHLKKIASGSVPDYKLEKFEAFNMSI